MLFEEKFTEKKKKKQAISTHLWPRNQDEK